MLINIFLYNKIFYLTLSLTNIEENMEKMLKSYKKISKCSIDDTLMTMNLFSIMVGWSVIYGWFISSAMLSKTVSLLFFVLLFG